MMAHTHVMIGVTGYAAYSYATGGSVPLDSITIGAAALGSLAPDIDHPKSWLGKRLIFVSLPLTALFGHRGITHSLFAALGATAGLWWLFNNSPTLPFSIHWIVSFLVGYILHLFADWNSNSGIPLLWPNIKKFRAPWAINTGGFFEHLFAVFFACFLTWCAWSLFLSGNWRTFI
jgi:inner membrane protein